MRVVVVDVEATCSDDGTVPRSEMEVIEIGAVCVDLAAGSIIEEFASFVKPVVHPKLTPFCVSLTGIKQKDVDEASAFPTVFGSFCDWMTSLGKTSFCSWGRFDDDILRRDCGFHGIEYPFVNHSDLSRIFQKMYGRRKGHRGAMEIMGLVPEGWHHRGLSDAKNVAKMVPALLKGIR